MQVYLTTVILVCSVAAIASALAAEGKTKKHVRFLLSLIVMLVLLSPLVNLTSDGWDLQDFSWIAGNHADGEQDGERGEVLLRAAANALSDALCGDLNIPAAEVKLGIDGEVDDDGQVRITRVTVTLSGDAAARREAVRAYLKRQMKCDCEVRVYVNAD